MAVGALVTGVFGMNLLSHVEDHPRLFWPVTGGIYAFIVLATAAALVAFGRAGVL